MNPAATSAPPRRIVLAGNPNVGKTTLFNRLTGGRAKVGNYPGVTVEREVGSIRLERAGTVLVEDAPGAYSLSSRSAEERIALLAVLGLPPHEVPDLVLLVLDATQLTRNLYLALQVIEAGLPVVIALNMTDLLGERGLDVDAEALGRALGVPCIPLSAQSSDLAELRRVLDDVLEAPERAAPGPRWTPDDPALSEDVEAVAALVPDAWCAAGSRVRVPLALWALLSIDVEDELEDVPDELRACVLERRRRAADAGREIEREIVSGRYGWIDERAAGFLREPPAPPPTLTDRLDRVLLHPVLGFALFLLTMGVVFQSLFSWADPAIGWIEGAFGALNGAVEGVLPAGLVRDFVTSGLIEGVGSVVVFLPQILLLFLFIAVMEDTGYMARVAFLMDRIMKSLGLHGRAFVPMMSGFACAVPAILATRTMERRRDRMVTMMVIPLMTCSARLPVYTLIIGALFAPDDTFGPLPVQGLLMVGMYVFSIVVALVCAAVLGRTLFRGPRVPLLLELPPYRRPHAGTVLRAMLQRCRVFLTEAGTVIFACTIIMWALLSFPKDPAVGERYDGLRAQAAATVAAGELNARLAALDTEQRGAELRSSWGGQLGRAIEPAIEPLGFDWKMGVGILGAFMAREVFVSTMGVVYGLGDEVDEESTGLRDRLRNEAREDGTPVYTPLVGLSLMVFFALACQCVSTLAVVKRETRSYLWPTFLFAYNGALAWVASFVVFQGGRLLGFG